MCNDLTVSAPFSIDLWSDVVCPFCYLGSRQLAGALELFEHREDVVLRHHAFELDPKSPPSFDQTLAQLVAEKYAMPVERALELHHRLEGQAEELGMTWSLTQAQPSNTFDAHRLIALAASQGRAEEMSERLFRGYFCEGARLSDHEQLNALAKEVGVLDAALLWETEAFARDVRHDEESAQELGITSVPAFLIDNKFMILGAQGVDHVLDVLRRAWARRAA
jgi:predicted DsbA family dithiol-disulfide isomerase